VVTILSFGFKHGIPVDSDLLFDVRFLPNPHFVPELRPHTGRDPEVLAYLDRSRATHEFLSHTLNLLKFLIPQYVGEGKSYLTIGIGCTGGRHRSVAVADSLKKGLGSIPGVRVRVKHRDIAHDDTRDAGLTPRPQPEAARRARRPAASARAVRRTRQ
jgi:UPF0042 nucleotide-binding protein